MEVPLESARKKPEASLKLDLDLGEASDFS